MLSRPSTYAVKLFLRNR